VVVLFGQGKRSIQAELPAVKEKTGNDVVL
jgi:hypothetical protein